VFPEGTGKPNPKGLDFYDRLVDELLKHGIEPYATLYHWDLPQALEDKVGGWRSSETSKAFGDYAGHVAARITDRVSSIFTINEAGRFVNFGYGWGYRCARPQTAGRRGQPGPPPCGAGARPRRAGDPRAWPRGHQVGPAENIAACVPAFDTPENVRAAEMATRELNSGFPRRDSGRQIHRRVSAVRRPGRAEIHRCGVEDHFLAQ
jgi:beta-glucosidase